MRAGDSLQSIAQNLYGDSSLWYKLAEANGLSGQAALFEGQTLRLPAGVVRNTYNASTITPYNPGETLGDVNPSTPQAQPPKKNKCGVLGQILVVVISVVVQGVLDSILPGAGTAVGQFIRGATIAAASSIVSQGAAMAMGIQDKFDWKGVGMAAISGGLGGGAGKTGNIIKDAAQSMVRSAVTQGIGVTLGLQDKFSWAAVAAAGVGSAAGSMASGLAGSAGAAVSKALGDGVVAGKIGTVVTGTITGMAELCGPYAV